MCVCVKESERKRGDASIFVNQEFTYYLSMQLNNKK